MKIQISLVFLLILSKEMITALPPSRTFLDWLNDRASYGNGYLLHALFLLSLPFVAACLLSSFAKAEQFQEVLKIECEGGAFMAQGRPFNENEAGSSMVERQYLYRGKILRSFDYERYYKNLDSFLAKDRDVTHAFPLHLPTDGDSHSGGYFDQGDTLYMPPSEFSKTDFDALTLCIEKNLGGIKKAFADAIIKSSAFLGLMRTESSFGVQGIARLIYRTSPILEIYNSVSWLMLLVDSDGKVSLRTNFTSNNKGDSVDVGAVVLSANGQRIIRARDRIFFQGSEYKFSDFANLQNSGGRRLKDDFVIEIP